MGGADRIPGTAQRIPRDRGWPIDELLSAPQLDGWGQVCDAGGFLDNSAQFDPAFFGITHREALVLNPQQRVAMRVAWRVLENSGINPDTVAGTEAGCFVGMSPMEYGPRAATADAYSGHRIASLGQLGAAGRISHSLGLIGPSMCVDAACASSLTALQLAANAVRNDECDWALAGGACVMGSPAAFFEFARLNALSDDGHCRAYADDASGTVWGEGAGMVLVERESRARQLGHPILGRIMAARTNHNGKGKPLLVPRVRAQEQLISRTLDAAGIDPADVGMIEGHGTATRAGDPVEVLAMFKTYGASGCEALLGSIKSTPGTHRQRPGILRADQAAARRPARPRSAHPVCRQPDQEIGLGPDGVAAGDQAAPVAGHRRIPLRRRLVLRCRRLQRARRDRNAGR